MQQDRQLREYVIGQHQAQQAAIQGEAWAKGEDAKWEKWLAETYPQYANGAARKELGAVAREITSDRERESFNNYRDARSFEGQKHITQSAMWEIAQRKARDLNSKRAPVPPVQRPGTYRPAGAGAMDRIRDLGSPTCQCDRESIGKTYD
jgi:hypothetical protein